MSPDQEVCINYRKLGKTGLMVSEVGFGGEWLERHPEEESIGLIRYAGEKGINIIDCWMPDPKSRDIIGKAIADRRDKWFVQGHLGSTYQNGQYVRTRDLTYVKPAFEDLLTRIGGGYIDLGMIHYVDAQEDWDAHIAHGSPYLDYVFELKRKGIIRHIGLSTHNPRIAEQAAKCGFVEMILFSINPAFDMRPATEDLDSMFEGYENADYAGIDPERAAARLRRAMYLLRALQAVPDGHRHRHGQQVLRSGHPAAGGAGERPAALSGAGHHRVGLHRLPGV